MGSADACMSVFRAQSSTLTSPGCPVPPSPPPPFRRPFLTLPCHPCRRVRKAFALVNSIEENAHVVTINSAQMRLLTREEFAGQAETPPRICTGKTFTCCLTGEVAHAPLFNPYAGSVATVDPGTFAFGGSWVKCGLPLS